MKLETLEHFLNKDQSLWNREDIDKLTSKYGNTAIFYDTLGITNKLVMLFKHRDMSIKDNKIIEFIEGKNKEYIYVIDYLGRYLDYIEFVFWPSEKALHTIYKILCERVLSDYELKKDSEEYIKLKKLYKKILLIRYSWYIKSIEEKNKGDKNENK